MKRMQVLILVAILVFAPFLKARAYYFCSMRPGPAHSACCCAPATDACGGSAEGGGRRGGSCCKIVPVPPVDRFGSVAPAVAAPDLTGLLAPAFAALTPVGLTGDGLVRRVDRAPPRAPDRPLFLFHSSFLS